MSGTLAVCMGCLVVQYKLAIPPRRPSTPLSIILTGFEHYCPVCDDETHFEYFKGTLQ